MLLCHYNRIRKLDYNSSIVLLPYFRLNRYDDFIISVVLTSGQNQWCDWFCQLSLTFIYWEVTAGLRYKKLY